MCIIKIQKEANLSPLNQEARGRGNLGWKRMSAAQQVFRKVAAGRFKERALTPVYALAEACSFRDRVFAGMNEAGLKPEDSAVGIVFLDSDHSGLYLVKLTPGAESSVLDKMMKITAVTIGVVVVIRDHERDHRLIKAIPFLKGEQALKWLSQILDREEVSTYVS